MTASVKSPERLTASYVAGKAPKSKTAPFRVVSLFAGCGGMDLGFRGDFSFLGQYYHGLPFDVIWANEINEAACRTYRRNLGEHVVHGDIWERMGEMPLDADVVIGGFPCQDISVNGKGAGVAGNRSGLYRAMVQAVGDIEPKMFIAENVKGLLMKHNQGSLEQVLRDFRALGYDVTYKLYMAADFGVPQTRERVIIVGRRADVAEFTPPTPTHSKDNWISAKKAISDLATLERDDDFNHVWSAASVSGEQGNRHLQADRPGYTIRAECHGNIQFHYEQPRRISMREAARFQSFPDDFIFESKLRETERQVGNAVPPVLAWHIAKSVAATLQELPPPKDID